MTTQATVQYLPGRKVSTLDRILPAVAGMASGYVNARLARQAADDAQTFEMKKLAQQNEYERGLKKMDIEGQLKYGEMQYGENSAANKTMNALSQYYGRAVAEAKVISEALMYTTDKKEKKALLSELNDKKRTISKLTQDIDSLQRSMMSRYSPESAVIAQNLGQQPQAMPPQPSSQYLGVIPSMAASVGRAFNESKKTMGMPPEAYATLNPTLNPSGIKTHTSGSIAAASMAASRNAPMAPGLLSQQGTSGQFVQKPLKSLVSKYLLQGVPKESIKDILRTRFDMDEDTLSLYVD